MFRFRGKRKDSGEWVVGYYMRDMRGIHYIAFGGAYSAEIYPHTLSISTGKKDSKGEEIFASFPLDGVMTEGGGGDVVEVKGLEGEKYGIRYSPYIYSFTMHRINSEFDLTCHISNIDSQDITIIGKQGGGHE